MKSDLTVGRLRFQTLVEIEKLFEASDLAFVLFLCEMTVDLGLNQNQMVRSLSCGDVRNNKEINVLLVAFDEMETVVLSTLSVPIPKDQQRSSKPAKMKFRKPSRAFEALSGNAFCIR